MIEGLARPRATLRAARWRDDDPATCAAPCRGCRVRHDGPTETGAATLAPACPHIDQIRDVTPRTPDGCEECLASGDRWVQLRLCLTCGHVGCCDSSPRRHATRHYRATGHPIVRSFEPGEDWLWCYEDRLMVSDASSSG